MFRNTSPRVNVSWHCALACGESWSGAARVGTGYSKIPQARVTGMVWW